MQAILPALAAGGIVGAADQYLCLLIFGMASRIGWIELSPEMAFMESWWFLGIVALIWAITVLPAYAASFAPGLANTLHSIINFVSGFLVPASSAVIALASLGIIREIHPDINQALLTLGMFDAETGLSSGEVVLMGGSALSATSLNIMKALSKPAFSVSTGTIGSFAAPIYASIENVASIVLMTLIFLLADTNPQLLVLLFAVVVVISLLIFGYALYLLWKLKKGLGLLIVVLQKDPRLGLACLSEFFVWGSGWFFCAAPQRAWRPFLVWLGMLGLFLLLLPVAGALLLLFIPYIVISLMIFGLIGAKRSQGLLKAFGAQAAGADIFEIAFSSG